LPLFAFLFTYSSTLGQVCPGTEATVVIQSALRESPNAFTFEVAINNSGTPTLTFAALGGGILGVPVGTTGTLTVVEQPSANGFALNNFTPNYSTTAGFGTVPLMRWTNTPVTSGFPTMPVSSTKVAKLRFTRTGGTLLPSGDFPLTWQPTGSANAPAVTSYCNGNGSSVPLTQGAGLITMGATVFPIDLLDFSAKALDKINVIEWSTASELNTAWHIVERSASGSDNWEQIGKVGGAGTSSDQHNYKLEDKQPLAKSYYRLRSVDFDDQEELSKVVLVSRRSGIFGVTGAYPSPTSDRVSVQFESLGEEVVTLQIFDFNGRLVLQQEALADKGVNLTEVDMSSLQAGTYTIHLVSTDVVSAQVKVVKQ
jgi:hypothetical protein